MNHGRNLPARWIIHTVGPNYRAGQGDPALLHSCYRRAVHGTHEIGAHSVAFPLIGTGVYGWPKQAAIEAATDTILAMPSRVEQVRLVVPDEGGFGQP